MVSIKNIYGGINVYFIGFKVYCFTFLRIFQSCFLCMEISIRPYTFLQFIATLCIKINLINLPKQQFIAKTWSFTKTKLCYSLKLKTDSLSQLEAKKTPSEAPTLPFIVRVLNFTKNRLCHRLQKCIPS